MKPSDQNFATSWRRRNETIRTAGPDLKQSKKQTESEGNETKTCKVLFQNPRFSLFQGTVSTIGPESFVSISLHGLFWPVRIVSKNWASDSGGMIGV